MISRSTTKVQAGLRFSFGENWLRWLATLNDARVNEAVDSLKKMLRRDSLDGLSFLDIGCGSGLFSLAARKLGASVKSVDNDPKSIACSKEIRRRYSMEDDRWMIAQGSILDDAYVKQLGTYDVVYAWGVLHHTGDMYQAFANIVQTVRPGGRLFIAVYNDQGWRSTYWSSVKRLFNSSWYLRFMLVLMHAPYLFGSRYLIHAINGRTPGRGMSLWYDTIDWLGGYPFEVAKTKDVIAFYEDRGFSLEHLKTCNGRMGCNEFVFRRERINQGE